jgi:hypothetical protein
LNIDGLSYTLYPGGRKIVSGVSIDTPRIPGYGEGEMKLRERLSLLSGLNLLNDLMTEYSQGIDYELVTKLDVGSFIPNITVKEKGIFNF